jgi:hypothetical protein
MGSSNGVRGHCSELPPRDVVVGRRVKGVEMMRRFRVALPLIVLYACSAAGGDTDQLAEAPPNTPLEISQEPILVLGVEDGDPDQVFHQISTPFVLPDGTIAIPLSGQSEVRIFDDQGELIRTLGGVGQGPGEFERLGASWSRGDTIEVLDLALQRLTRFIPEAELQIVRLARRVMWGLGATVEGWILLDMAEVGQARDNPRDQLVVYQFDRAGEHVADLTRVEGIRRVSLPGFMAAEIFSPTARFAVRGEHLYVGDTLEPEIRVLDGTGTVIRRIRVTPQTMAKPSAALEQVRVSMGRESPMDARTTRALFDQPLPEQLPAFSDFLVDDEGFVWVRPYVPTRDATVVGGNPSFHQSSAGGQWNIFSPDGVLVGTIDMPTDLEPYHVTVNAVVGIARDALGVERVRVHAVIRRTAGEPTSDN